LYTNIPPPQYNWALCFLVPYYPQVILNLLPITSLIIYPTNRILISLNDVLVIRFTILPGSGPGNGSFPGTYLGLFLVFLAEPPGGDALDLGVESHPVLAHHVQVAEEGVFMPREGEY